MKPLSLTTSVNGTGSKLNSTIFLWQLSRIYIVLLANGRLFESDKEYIDFFFKYLLHFLNPSLIVLSSLYTFLSSEILDKDNKYFKYKKELFFYYFRRES